MLLVLIHGVASVHNPDSVILVVNLSFELSRVGFVYD